MLDSTTKRCSKCKQEKPADLEHFTWRKSRNTFMSWCRECCKQAKKERRRDPSKKEMVRAADERQRQNIQNDPIRKAAKQKSKKIYRQRPEQVLKHREEERDRGRRPEVQGKRKEYLSNYNKSPVGKAKDKAKHAKRNAQKRALPHVFTDRDWIKCLEYWGRKCAICGRTQDLWTTLAADHWIALSDPRIDNPGTVTTNIVPLCHPIKGGVRLTGYCNTSKKNKDAKEWLTQEFGERKANSILKQIATYFDWITEQNRIENDIILAHNR